MFLFTAGAILSAGVVVVSYINFNMVFEYFEQSLKTLEQFAATSKKLAPYPDPKESYSLLLQDIQVLSQKFKHYQNRVYVQIVIFAIIVMILFAITITSLKQSVVSRLETLRNFTISAYTEGFTHKRLHLAGQDELTDFVALFNKALDAIDIASSDFSGKIAQTRRFIVTLIADVNIPTAYFRMSGDFLGSNLKQDEEDRVMEIMNTYHQEFQLLKHFQKTYAFNETKDIIIETIGPEADSLLLIKASLQDKEGQVQEISLT